MKRASTTIATALFVAAMMRGDARADAFQRVFVGNFIGYSTDPVNYFSLSSVSSRADNSASFYIENW